MRKRPKCSVQWTVDTQSSKQAPLASWESEAEERAEGGSARFTLSRDRNISAALMFIRHLRDVSVTQVAYLAFLAFLCEFSFIVFSLRWFQV
jgi:hypothetical protein